MERITGRHNPLMTHIRKLLSSRSYRRQCGEYICDGTKLLQEAVHWGAEVTVLVATHPEQLPLLPENARLVQVPEELMSSISPMEAPQGALFIVRQPKNPLPERLQGPLLVLDGLQDPGNVGTILRTADAFDCDLLLLEGCADPYNHKAARASMGAVFRRTVYEATLEQLTKLLRESGGLPLYGAALGLETKDLRQTDLKNCAVAVGSEGQGLRREVLDLCQGTVKIPMQPRCESLNAAAAAAVLLWEMYR